MNILVLYSRAPFPLTNGGNLRLFHYARVLGRRHNLDLLVYGEGNPPSEIIPFFRRIRAFPRPRTRRPEALWTRLWRAFSVRHMIAVDPAFREHVSSVVHEGDYDLVWVGGEDMQVLLPREHSVPVLLDDCDYDLLALRGLIRTSRNLASLLQHLKRYWLTQRFNKRLHPQVDAALYVSAEDARAFQRACPSVPAHVVENGVDPDYFAPQGSTKDAVNIVFEGNMGFAPNIDVAQYLSRTILPLIRERLGSPVKLTIVGKDPSPEILNLASGEIEITGFVDDVRPFLDRASVFVCPMRIGTGIKNKILQAWSMALPVVATPISLGGLDARDGENIMVADSPEEFAERTIELIQNPDLRRRIGDAGRQTILDHYTWDRKAAQMETIMESTAKRRA